MTRTEALLLLNTHKDPLVSYLAKRLLEAWEILLRRQWVTEDGAEYGRCLECWARDYKGHEANCAWLQALPDKEAI